MTFGDIYRDKTVMVTGHTGFKGSWLSMWLCMLGAKVVGYSLKPDQVEDPCFTNPSHFTELGLRHQIFSHVEKDVQSLHDLEKTINIYNPDFIFHLAAQPLVFRAYDEPHLTVKTNIIGTLNLLEAVRRKKKSCVLIMITTDKVYDNEEWIHSYRETDRLGGYDLYSASKTGAEILIKAYCHSFFDPIKNKSDGFAVGIAPVRGGNVIGGGDWADNRIVPDVMKSLVANEPLAIRNRQATRPWQHVLELLGGYLHLGSLIYQRLIEFLLGPVHYKGNALHELKKVCSPFNFGPLITSNKPVGTLVEEIFKLWPGTIHDQTTNDNYQEANLLHLNIDKAYHFLGWKPKWNFEETIYHTVTWYRQFYESGQNNPEFVKQLTQSQIQEYSKNLTFSVMY